MSSDNLPTTTDDVLSSLGSLSIPTYSYSTDTQALSSVLSVLSKAHITRGGGSSQPTNSSNNNKKSSQTGVIAGVATGGVVALGLIGGLVWFFVSRSNRNQANGEGGEPFNQQPASDIGGIPSTPNMSNVHGSYGASLTPYGSNPTTPHNPAGYNTNFGPGVAPSPIPINNNNNNLEGAYYPNAYVPSQGGTDNQSQFNSPSLGGPPQQTYRGENYNNPITESNVPPPGSSLPYNNNAAENWNNVPSTNAQGGYGVQRPGQPYSGAPKLS